MLASGDSKGGVKVWKVADGKCLRQLNVELSPELAAITLLKFNPSTAKLYASCLDRSVKVFGLKSNAILKELRDGHEGYIQSIDFVRYEDDNQG